MYEPSLEKRADLSDALAQPLPETVAQEPDDRCELSGSLPDASVADGAAPRAVLDIPPKAYANRSREPHDAAAAPHRALHDATHARRTSGCGPRLPHRGHHELEIPDAAFTFSTLKDAQATGDLDTLPALGLPAERVRLEGSDPAAAMRQLTVRIKEAL